LTLSCYCPGSIGGGLARRIDKIPPFPHITPLDFTRIRLTRNQALANTAQAKKRIRQAENNRVHNVAFRSSLRTAIKKVVSAIEAGNKEQAAELYKAAVPVIDKMQGKGLIHANKAARHKSRLNSRIRAL
jgi:small subunit ribosomal protein S20